MDSGSPLVLAFWYPSKSTFGRQCQAAFFQSMEPAFDLRHILLACAKDGTWLKVRARQPEMIHCSLSFSARCLRASCSRIEDSNKCFTVCTTICLYFLPALVHSLNTGNRQSHCFVKLRVLVPLGPPLLAKAYSLVRLLIAHGLLSTARRHEGQLHGTFLELCFLNQLTRQLPQAKCPHPTLYALHQ